MKARAVVTRSGKHFRGKFPSRKMNRMVHWESILERDAILHFEHHNQVVSYQEQPSLEFYYDIDGSIRKYFPDFLVRFRDGKELLIEVKPSLKLASPEVQKKLQAVSKRFVQQGRSFRIMTETDIRREPLFSNLKKIQRSGKQISETPFDKQLASQLKGASIWQLGDLVAKLCGLHKVLRLIQSRHLQVNLEQELTDDALVMIASKKGGAHGSFLL